MKRRALLQAGSIVLSLGAAHFARGATIMTVRVWPASEYSRVTIESDAALSPKQTFVPNPPRLAVDLEGIVLNPALRELVAKVKADDPNIAGIRVGQFTPRIVRLVIDLKHPIKPQVFSLAPVAAYQHRLVFDLYPVDEVDPMDALIADRIKDSNAAKAAAANSDPLDAFIAMHAPGAATSGNPSNVPKTGASRADSAGPSSQNGSKTVPPETVADSGTDRLIIVALDPGHGAKTPVRSAQVAPVKKTWCSSSPIACASASTPPRSTATPCVPT
jgi:N-acetylmuramoyl-L-alanine amidase